MVFSIIEGKRTVKIPKEEIEALKMQHKSGIILFATTEYEEKPLSVAVGVESGRWHIRVKHGDKTFVRTVDKLERDGITLGAKKLKIDINALGKIAEENKIKVPKHWEDKKIEYIIKEEFGKVENIEKFIKIMEREKNLIARVMRVIGSFMGK